MAMAMAMVCFFCVGCQDKKASRVPYVPALNSLEFIVGVQEIQSYLPYLAPDCPIASQALGNVYLALGKMYPSVGNICLVLTIISKRTAFYSLEGIF